MTLRLARTNAEAHMYMELHPCESCGEGDFAPINTVVVEAEGDLASRYAGPCPRCGTAREFMFKIPEQIIMPDFDDDPVFGDAYPSELLDPGEWLWLADALSRGLPAKPRPGMTEEQRREARRHLLLAAAALDEVMKFVPEGAETVPGEALWTDRGLGVYTKDPGRFYRRRLDAVARTYRDIADRFRDAPPAVPAA